MGVCEFLSCDLLTPARPTEIKMTKTHCRCFKRFQCDPLQPEFRTLLTVLQAISLHISVIYPNIPADEFCVSGIDSSLA